MNAACGTQPQEVILHLTFPPLQFTLLQFVDLLTEIVHKTDRKAGTGFLIPRIRSNSLLKT